MIKEVCITIYLFVFKVIFNFFKLFPLKNKITFVVSFGDNSQYILEEIQKQEIAIKTIILFKGKSYLHFQSYPHLKKIPFDTYNIFTFLRTIYHLATSRHILIDNYFGFLAATKFKKEAEVIQLWHASGALKKFGLEDISIKNRSKRANLRFRKVYKNFHKVIVGSDIMANIFIRSFNISPKQILRTGIPRTDFFYQRNTQQIIVDRILKSNPELHNKKIILYAPTYRDNQLELNHLNIDMEEVQKQLGEGYILILRLHPAINITDNYQEKFPGFVFDYSSPKYDINELLLISDYLVTDYSSIPYEFSILNKPMIFYTYDLEEYKNNRGLIEDFEESIPGPIVRTTEELIHTLKENKFDLELLGEYSTKWNKYSNGNSSKNLVNYLFQEQNIKLSQEADSV
ncbi:CDP-glycerol glycerophosphotransferase family protein [Bacillus sp. FJAT-49732]|uniref:CDP-glycerol glycerophosphotransferase family protein n=1 Tax=Lederbergia citrisecunda TaxID=2833583 RepID=A0A942TQZ5_9BACI|nr:CDP-glycerol glycerophosphotransferase family protein [Lederbergia citrisecunda]MBS4200649.1 CDP-glycerol glycerophosphotransferase family protein [Lederbergia citrisecunda]